VVENEEGGSNVGIVVGKDSILIVDSTLFPSKFQQILDFCNPLARKPVIGVFLTHYHPDHSFGAMKSPLEKLVNENTQRVLESLPESYLNDLRSRLGSSGRELSGLAFERFIKIEDGSSVDLGSRTVRFFHLGGHTPDLTVAYVEDAGVLFASDLLITTVHAEIVEDSDLNAWTEAVERLYDLHIDHLVPGHGISVKGTENLLFTKRYLEFAMSMIESLYHSDMKRLDLPSEFQQLRFPELLAEGVVRKLG